jgi:hypothetical protein
VQPQRISAHRAWKRTLAVRTGIEVARRHGNPHAVEQICDAPRQNSINRQGESHPLVRFVDRWCIRPRSGRASKFSRCHVLPKAGRSTAWRDTTRTEPQRAVDTITGLGHSATAQP